MTTPSWISTRHFHAVVCVTSITTNNKNCNPLHLPILCPCFLPRTAAWGKKGARLQETSKNTFEMFCLSSLGSSNEVTARRHAPPHPALPHSCVKTLACRPLRRHPRTDEKERQSSGPNSASVICHKRRDTPRQGQPGRNLHRRIQWREGRGPRSHSRSNLVCIVLGYFSPPTSILSV